MQKYETVIGLEVHIELATKSKIYCGCSTEFGQRPNENVCPVCMGLPGALPVLNEEVLNYAIMAGLATNCNITRRGYVERKNYFYPDSPTGYQISQSDHPICTNGYLDIQTQEGKKRVRIHQIHIEEDAGKLSHDKDKGSLIDLNRHGVGLIELVTEPDMSSKEEAVAFLQKLRAYVSFIGISDAKMNEGSFRCDVNISTKPAGQVELGQRAEIKNLNSFQSVMRAIEYEEKRQRQALDNGEVLIQETRGYSQDSRITYSMRTKEDAADYRYVPDPDLMPIVISDEKISDLRENLPELPETRARRYKENYKISAYDADQLTTSSQVAEFFEEAASHTSDYESLANLIISEIFSHTSTEDFSVGIRPKDLAQVVNIMATGRINHGGAKKIIGILLEEDLDVEEIIKAEDLEQISDRDQLEPIIDQVVKDNQKAVSEYKSGKEKALQSLIGQTMARTKGKANPQLTIQILKEKIK